jgi:hypothetical protein
MKNSLKKNDTVSQKKRIFAYIFKFSHEVSIQTKKTLVVNNTIKYIILFILAREYININHIRCEY